MFSYHNRHPYVPRQVCPPTIIRQHFENIPRQVLSPTTSYLPLGYVRLRLLDKDYTYNRVNLTVNHIAGRRTARSSPLSQSLFLLKYQMKRREPRRERVASRGRSDTRRWSADRRRVSAFVHHQAIGVYSCFREDRNELGWSSSEYTPNAGLVRQVCPTNTRR